MGFRFHLSKPDPNSIHYCLVCSFALVISSPDVDTGQADNTKSSPTTHSVHLSPLLGLTQKTVFLQRWVNIISDVALTHNATAEHTPGVKYHVNQSKQICVHWTAIETFGHSAPSKPRATSVSHEKINHRPCPVWKGDSFRSYSAALVTLYWAVRPRVH